MSRREDMARMRMIVNPAAGAYKTARKWPEIMDLLRSLGLEFEHDVTEAPGHGIELAKAAVEEGCDLVISVGGDGTINEVVNGIYKAGALGTAALGIINTGTGADYIRTLGIPRRYKEACHSLANPKVKVVVDLGVAEYVWNGQPEKRLFVNFAGLGFDAEIVRATTEKFKAMGDMPSYLMGLLSTLFSYQNRDVSLVVDGEPGARKVCTVMLNNGKYAGGGMIPAPHADPGDGFFDVMVIDDIAKPDLIWSLPRLYRGTHLTHPKVTLMRAREVEVKPSVQMAVEADGELLGEAPARFSIMPAALTIVI
ncbi:MAG TPA: diacylglycerol kinase family lipid kinase [Dehalococcoidia bacterium]|nr:diacylglycerol kinase family lipid kinase [Dehalococcoidia bacterium]